MLVGFKYDFIVITYEPISLQRDQPLIDHNMFFILLDHLLAYKLNKLILKNQENQFLNNPLNFVGIL